MSIGYPIKANFSNGQHGNGGLINFIDLREAKE
jgi:hypothetical protein